MAFDAASAQRAAGFIAARRRGDEAGAEALLSGFESEGERTLAFYAVADLALQLLGEAEGGSPERAARRLSLALAALEARDPDR